MKKYKNSFLTKDELKKLRKLELSERQIKIIDTIKSWSVTSAIEDGDNSGFTPLATCQILEEIGDVDEKTIRRDIHSLVCIGYISKRLVSVDGVRFKVNAYKLDVLN